MAESFWSAVTWQWQCHAGLNHCACSSTQCRKKDQAIGRSKGGLSTKIHVRTDTLGNPTGFYLTAGQAHDLNGADVLLNLSLSQTWPILWIKPTIPRLGWLISVIMTNIFIRQDIWSRTSSPSSSSIEVLLHAMINWLKISCQRSTLPQSWYGLIDDTP